MAKVIFVRGLPSVEIDKNFVVLTDTYGLRSNVVILKGTVDTSNLAAVKVRVNNGRWADARFADGHWEIAMPVRDLQSGQELKVSVNAVDRFGQLKQVNMGETVLLSEGNPPDTTLTAGPSGMTDALTATVSFSGTAGDNDVVGFECQLDNGGYAPCTSPFVAEVTSNGKHTLHVRAIDAIGNVDGTPASATWTVRVTSLETTLTSTPSSPSTSREASFGFAADGASAFECALDGVAFAECSSPQTYAGLEDGSHSFDVRAKDATGKTGAATRFTWAIVNGAPVAQDQAVTVASNRSVAITLNATDSDGLHYKLVSKPTNGVLLGIAPGLVYQPATGFVGEDSFTFKASDSEKDSNVATVHVTVTPPVTTTKGRITVMQDAQPDSIQNFRFGGDLGAFQLDDASPSDGDAVQKTIDFEVAPGSYAITQAVPASWHLTVITCEGGDATVQLADKKVSVDVVANAHITCTFVDQRDILIVAGAWDDANANRSFDGGEPTLSDWKMMLYDQNVPENPPLQTAVTGAGGQATFAETQAGRYRICESVQAGWQNSYTGLKDDNGDPCYWQTLPPGVLAELWFGNFKVTSAASLAPESESGSTQPKITQRPDVSSDDAGYGAVVNTKVTIFLPMVAR